MNPIGQKKAQHAQTSLLHFPQGSTDASRESGKVDVADKRSSPGLLLITRDCALGGQ